MNKKLLIIIIGALAVFGIGLYYFLPRSSSNNNTSNTTVNQPSVNVGVVNVAISNFNFNPREIRVKAGEKVIWTNNDLAGHLVNADDGTFVSEVLSQGKTFEHIFSVKGVFPYHCKIHPSMKGKVMVE